MIYEPKEDSYLLKKEVKRFSKGKKVLDLGSGSGIQALAALKSGAKDVLAADINKEAIIILKNKGLNALESDLFSKIKGKFDLIVFNPPYLPQDKREDSESKIITTGGKKGDEIILRFLKQVKKHLEKQGIILMVLSSLTPKKRILTLLDELSLKKESISKLNLFMEFLEVWKIEFSNKKV